jgi:DNA mismatch repair protein MutS
MSFYSILFREPDGGATAVTREAPAFFPDLNLDQIVEAVTAEWREYDLAAFFYCPLTDVDSIAYRQEVLHDLKKTSLRGVIQQFSERMREMRKCLLKAKEFAQFKHAQERWFLCAVETYIDAIRRLSEVLDSCPTSSRGFIALRAYLSAYSRSAAFQKFASETEQCKADLSSIQYCVLVRNGGVTVSRYSGEPDYSSAIEASFARFHPIDARGRRTPQRGSQEMNHVQAQVLDGLAQLYPDIFHALSVFHSSYQDYLDETVVRFDREIQFYVAYLTFIEKFQRAGLTFSRPQVSRTSKEVHCHNGFDLALAQQLFARRAKVVPNDFHLSGSERILVVTGPNQGGKTTFARTFGQMHYLASLGCTVPGTDVRLYAFDQLFSHFERREDIRNLRGKLQDDLVRVRQILDAATPASLIVMNEMFSSTTVKDAIYLSAKVMNRVSELDALCVWVTFLDELASFNEKTVSMVSTVDPENAAVRTYKVERKNADGLAYALAIALKYRVTYDCLKERIQT